MTNDAPHKSKPSSAANLQQTCGQSASIGAKEAQAAEAFYLLWQQTLRAAASGADIAPKSRDTESGDGC